MMEAVKVLFIPVKSHFASQRNQHLPLRFLEDHYVARSQSDSSVSNIYMESFYPNIEAAFGKFGEMDKDLVDMHGGRLYSCLPPTCIASIGSTDIHVDSRGGRPLVRSLMSLLV